MLAETERMNYRTCAQVAEAVGAVNRWYCSQYYRREITDHDVLMEYFVRNRGAEDFARRYIEAMGMANRWYCSEYYQRDVREPEVLWAYYMKTRQETRAIAC